VDVAAEDALRPEAHRPADRQADPRNARQFAGDLHGRLAGPDYDHALAAKRVLRPVLRLAMPTLWKNNPLVTILRPRGPNLL
jgi:hypothetical protein